MSAWRIQMEEADRLSNHLQIETFKSQAVEQKLGSLIITSICSDRHAHRQLVGCRALKNYMKFWGFTYSHCSMKLTLREENLRK